MAGLNSPDGKLRTNPCPKDSVFDPSWGFPSASNFTPPSSPLHLGTLGHSFEISDVFSGPSPGPPRSGTIPFSISDKNYHFSLALNLHVGPRIDHFSIHEAFHLYRIAHNLVSSTEQGLEIRHTHTHKVGQNSWCIHVATPVLSAANKLMPYYLQVVDKVGAVSCDLARPSLHCPDFSLGYSVTSPASVGCVSFHHVLCD